MIRMPRFRLRTAEGLILENRDMRGVGHGIRMARCSGQVPKGAAGCRVGRRVRVPVFHQQDGLQVVAPALQEEFVADRGGAGGSSCMNAAVAR